MDLRIAQGFDVRVVAVLTAVALNGCAPVGPNYLRPDIDAPDAWHEEISIDVAEGPESSLQTWWQLFDDPALDDLIERARLSNLDLKIAFSRISETRARLGIATGERVPVVGGSASVSRGRLSDDGPLQQAAPPGGFEAQNVYDVGVGASWEIDVFGRIRRGIESAGAEYEASIEQERDVRVALFAEVALAYVQVRAFEQQMAYANANVESQTASLALAQDRYDSGISSKLDVAQARSNLGNTRASIPLLEIGRNQALNRLAVLLGQDAGSLQAEFGKTAPIPVPPEIVGAGVPADVLRQRPDIRRAERQLAAQTAQIGVATADLYPSFSLGGFIGLQSRTLGNFFDESSVTSGVGFPIQWALFSGGRIRSNIEVQEELTEQALLNYEHLVLVAFEEVANAIVAYNQDQVRRENLRQAVNATDEAVELVLIQYNAGLTDFNNVLTTQRDLFEQQDQLVSSEAQVVLDLISLYKALGGGWDFQSAEL